MMQRIKSTKISRTENKVMPRFHRVCTEFLTPSLVGDQNQLHAWANGVN